MSAKKFEFSTEAIRTAYTPYLRQLMEAQMQLAGVDQAKLDQIRAGWAEWDALPEEEKQAREKERASKAEAARVARHDANVKRWEFTLLNATEANPVLAAVVRMHNPELQYRDYDECRACKDEVSGYEYDMDEWPCDTFTTIEEGLGLA